MAPIIICIHPMCTCIMPIICIIIPMSSIGIVPDIGMVLVMGIMPAIGIVPVIGIVPDKGIVAIMLFICVIIWSIMAPISAIDMPLPIMPLSIMVSGVGVAACPWAGAAAWTGIRSPTARMPKASKSKAVIAMSL